MQDCHVARSATSAKKAGVRARSAPDPFEPFVAYCTARLAEDPAFIWPPPCSTSCLSCVRPCSYPTLTARSATGLGVQASFSAVVKHYAVEVRACLPGGATARERGEGQSRCGATVLAHTANDVTVEQAQRQLHS